MRYSCPHPGPPHESRAISNLGSSLDMTVSATSKAEPSTSEHVHVFHSWTPLARGKALRRGPAALKTNGILRPPAALKYDKALNRKIPKTVMSRPDPIFVTPFLTPFSAWRFHCAWHTVLLMIIGNSGIFRPRYAVRPFKTNPPVADDKCYGICFNLITQ